MDWVQDLLARMEALGTGLVEVQVGDQKIIAQIGQDVLGFLRDNKTLLLKVGKRVFSDFLMMIGEGKDEEAFSMLASRMTAQDIIDRMNANAAALDEANDVRDDFYSALRSFVLNTLTPALVRMLVGMLA